MVPGRVTETSGELACCLFLLCKLDKTMYLHTQRVHKFPESGQALSTYILVNLAWVVLGGVTSNLGQGRP